MINSKPVGLSRERFDEMINACCDTLKRNKGNLYYLYNAHCVEMDINFRFRLDEILTMGISSVEYNIETNHYCKTDDNRYPVFEIKNMKNR